MSAPTNQPVDKQSGVFALLLRPFWMFFGNFILLISAANIFMGENRQSHVSDIFFWGMVVAMITVRFLDIKFLDGQTATGEPATVGQWRRYAILLAIIAAVIWSAAHMAAHLFKS